MEDIGINLFLPHILKKIIFFERTLDDDTISQVAEEQVKEQVYQVFSDRLG